MNIDWQAPFKLAFDLGLFLVGSLLVVIIVGFCMLLLYAIVKTFFQAFTRAKANVEGKHSKKTKKKEEPKLNHLKPVQ
jgi:hypothetical protein